MKRNDPTIDPFLRGYLDAALFTTDPEPPRGCDYVECGRAGDMYPSLPQYFIDQARLDCHKFKLACSEYLERAGDDEQNGADLFYTRAGAGVGYWDRGYDKDVSDVLSTAAKAMGEHYLDASELGFEEAAQ